MIFNPDNNGWKAGQYGLFLGESPALHDTINITYPVIQKLALRQVSQRWVFDEFNHDQSRLDMLNCPPSVAKVMLMNIAYQWEADSVASRAIAPMLAPFVTNSELWEALLENTNMECVAEGTLVLTPEGWKPIESVTVDDKVAQYDTETFEVKFVNPSRVVSKPHNGDMILFSGRNVHQLVTPNHRMPAVEIRSSKTFWKLAKEQSYYACNKFLSAGNATGEVSTLSYKERFLIAAQADGSVSDRYTGELCGTIPVRFGLKKERKIRRLFDICSNTGYSIRSIGKERTNGVRIFTVDVPVEDIPKCGIKSLKWIQYDAISSNYCREFLEEVVKWDGSTHKAGNMYYTSTVQDNAEIVQTIAHLAGVRTTVYRRADERKETFSASYSVNFTFNRGGLNAVGVSGSRIIKTVESYNGNVYCLTVPSGAFLVKSEGKISVTGNCTHAKTYSEIVRQCVTDPQDVFKMVMESKPTLDRAKTVNMAFDNLFLAGGMYNLTKAGSTAFAPLSDYFYYDAIMRGMWALYGLERIQFMTSFSATFANVEQGWFQSIGKAVQKIMLDELFCHAALDREVLKIELATPRGVEWMENNRGVVRQMLDEICLREIEWAPHLLGEGRSVVGYTVPLANAWVAWNAKECYDLAGLNDAPMALACTTKNPLPWMQNWIDIDKTQNAQQEGDGNNYALNTVAKDMTDDEVLSF